MRSFTQSRIEAEIINLLTTTSSLAARRKTEQDLRHRTMLADNG